MSLHVSCEYSKEKNFSLRKKVKTSRQQPHSNLELNVAVVLSSIKRTKMMSGICSRKCIDFNTKLVFLKSSELTPRLKTLNCIPCFTNLFRMHTWKRRDPEVIWPFSPDSATQQRVSTAWKHSQLPSRLLMHRWAVLLRVRKIIRKKTIFHTVVPPNPCCFCAGSRASQSTCQ